MHPWERDNPVQTLEVFLTENGGRATPPGPNPTIMPLDCWFTGNGNNAGNPVVRTVDW